MVAGTTQKILQTVLSKHLDPTQYQAFVFGSRATDKSRRFSDIDLGIEGATKIPGFIMQRIKGDFEESNLPYKIDVVDFSLVSDTFKQVACDRVPVF